MATIKTYSTEGFRERYMQDGQKLEQMLKSGFGNFFIVRVEEMIRLIRLPVPPARSTNHQLIYLTEGEAIMRIGSERYTIYKDQCLVVPAGQVFSFENVDINKGFLLGFHNHMLLGRLGKKDLLTVFEFLTVWGQPKLQLSAGRSRHVRALSARLLSEYSQFGLEHEELICSYLMALLCEINLDYAPAEINGLDTPAVATARRFKELLALHFKTEHSVAGYATKLNITPNHLNKTLKAVTGKSPTKWIDETIVLEAKMLLYQTALSVADIALELGFPDASYFSRLFKKQEGLSPLAFRKKIEKS